MLTLVRVALCEHAKMRSFRGYLKVITRSKYPESPPISFHANSLSTAADPGIHSSTPKLSSFQQEEAVLRGGAAHITHPRVGIDSGDLLRVG